MMLLRKAPYRNPYNMTMEQYKIVEEVVGAIRDAVGTKADILIGTHGQITTASAIHLAKVLEPFKTLVLKNPCLPRIPRKWLK